MTERRKCDADVVGGGLKKEKEGEKMRQREGEREEALRRGAQRERTLGIVLLLRGERHFQGRPLLGFPNRGPT